MKILHLELLVKTLKENEELKERVKTLSTMIKNRDDYWGCSCCKEIYSFDAEYKLCDNCTLNVCAKCVDDIKCEGECGVCGQDVYYCFRCFDEICYCGTCNKLCCDDCTWSCYECQKYFCEHHVVICSCGDYLCSNCKDSE